MRDSETSPSLYLLAAFLWIWLIALVIEELCT